MSGGFLDLMIKEAKRKVEINREKIGGECKGSYLCPPFEKNEKEVLKIVKELKTNFTRNAQKKS